MIAVNIESVAAGIFPMLLLSLCLFWPPFSARPLAGLVGGKKAGGVGAALISLSSAK